MFGECHLLSASGMSECNLHCVQAQTFVWFASVEKISYYRSGKTVDVCGVYAELVGASGDRVEQDVCSAVFVCPDHFIFGQGFLALSHIDFLTWPFVIVCAQRQSDTAFGSICKFRRALDVVVWR